MLPWRWQQQSGGCRHGQSQDCTCTPFNQSLPEGNSRHYKGKESHSSDDGADQSSAAGGAASSS